MVKYARLRSVLSQIRAFSDTGREVPPAAGDVVCRMHADAHPVRDVRCPGIAIRRTCAADRPIRQDAARIGKHPGYGRGPQYGENNSSYGSGFGREKRVSDPGQEQRSAGVPSGNHPPQADRPARPRIAPPPHTPRVAITRPPADRRSPPRPPPFLPPPPFLHLTPSPQSGARRIAALRAGDRGRRGPDACVMGCPAGILPPPPSPRRHVRSGGGSVGAVAGSAALPARAFSTCRRCGPAPIRRTCRFGVSRAGGDRIQPEGSPAQSTARHQNRPQSDRLPDPRLPEGMPCTGTRSRYRRPSAESPRATPG